MHTNGCNAETERTPLLTPSRRVNDQPNQECAPKPERYPPPSWTYHAMTLAFVFLSLILCLVVTVIFTAHSYVAPLLRTDPSSLAQNSIVFKTPAQFNVLNITSGGIWCALEGEATIDAALALDLAPNRLADKLVGWAVQRVGSVTVSTSGVQIYSRDEVQLATLDLPPVVLPLSTTYPPRLSYITVRFFIRPTHKVEDVLDFLTGSWEAGSIGVQLYVARGAIVGGTQASSWRRYLHVEKRDIRSTLQVDVPQLPGLPPPVPGQPRPIPDLARLVHLQSYQVLPPPPALRVVGAATLPNPLPSILHGKIALRLPFVVSLPPIGTDSSLSILRVETSPLSLTVPNISLAIAGQVLPLPSSSSIAPVSRFSSDFLAGRASPVLITTDFLRDLGMGELTLDAEFPAATTPPDVLRDVQISNMRITLRGEQIFTSAFVRAHVVPPIPLAAVQVNATRVWPDLLVYDGPVPHLWPHEDPHAGSYSGTEYDESYSEPDPMPLPRPIPPNAFARIRPDSWVIAHTEPSDGSPGVWIHAQVNDVPLVVLPGRDAELRGFIRKVLFNPGGAQAGVAGITAVAARVGGLVIDSKESGELELFGLPLRGETRVGKKSLHEPDWGFPLPKNPLPLPEIPAIPTIPTSLPSLPGPPFPHKPDPSHQASEPGSETEGDVNDDGEDWVSYDASNQGIARQADERESEELWQIGVVY